MTEISSSDGAAASAANGPAARVRRTFDAEYKLRVMAEADRCVRAGEVRELLRRESLSASHLTYWRRQRDAGALEALGRPRGRKPADHRDAQIGHLERRLERAEAELMDARRVIEAQGRVLAAVRRSVQALGRAAELRATIVETVDALAPIVGTRPACRALGAAPATVYRRRSPATKEAADPPRDGGSHVSPLRAGALGRGPTA